MGHVKGMFCMSINCIALGKRISFYRLKFNMTQEKLADLTDCSREYIAYLESGAKTPSLPILINLANVLHISVDELLVDSLDYSISSSDSDLHRLLLDCSEVEQTVIIRMAKELKATLLPPYSSRLANYPYPSSQAGKFDFSRCEAVGSAPSFHLPALCRHLSAG